MGGRFSVHSGIASARAHSQEEIDIDLMHACVFRGRCGCSFRSSFASSSYAIQFAFISKIFRSLAVRVRSTHLPFLDIMVDPNFCNLHIAMLCAASFVHVMHEWRSDTVQAMS